MGRKYLKIHSTPSGEAPEHIRNAWVGICIPYPEFSRIKGPYEVDLAGVLTGASRGKKKVFPISAQDAIDVLAQTQPEAALWWKRSGNYYGDFLFDADSCELVEKP